MCPNCGQPSDTPLTTNVLGVEHCGCYYADCREGVRCHSTDPIERTLDSMFKRGRRVPKLSAEETTKRAPLPVEVLASGALQDHAHVDVGIGRAAKSVRVPRQPKE